MIQINLLPDIKAEYVKAERTKRSVIVISFIVICASLGIVALLASIAYGVQKVQLSTTQDEIDKNEQTIQSEEGLDEVLTVQSQLMALTSLHETKPVASRLFNYIQQTTPQDVLIDTYGIDFEAYTISVEGSAPSLEQVNKYVDTLKFTEITYGTEESSGEKAFTQVVLIDFEKEQDSAKFTITMNVDKKLFSISSDNIGLVVPNIITTRSQTQSSEALFTPNEEEE